MIIKSKKTVEVEVEVEVNFPIFGKNNYHTFPPPCASWEKQRVFK